MDEIIKYKIAQDGAEVVDIWYPHDINHADIIAIHCHKAYKYKAYLNENTNEVVVGFCGEYTSRY